MAWDEWDEWDEWDGHMAVGQAWVPKMEPWYMGPRTKTRGAWWFNFDPYLAWTAFEQHVHRWGMMRGTLHWDQHVHVCHDQQIHLRHYTESYEGKHAHDPHKKF